MGPDFSEVYEMDETTTRKLEEELEKIKTDREALRFLEKHADDTFDSFYEYMTAYIADNSLEVSDIVRRSEINKNYVYQILDGTKRPGRDKVFALAIASGMNFNETNRALEVSGERKIYPKDERDAWIAVAINNGMQRVMEVNAFLADHGVEPLK